MYAGGKKRQYSAVINSQSSRCDRTASRLGNQEIQQAAMT